MSNNYCSI